MKDIEYISLHYENGTSKGIKSNCLCSNCVKDEIVENILFAVINFVDGNYKILSMLHDRTLQYLELKCTDQLSKIES